MRVGSVLRISSRGGELLREGEADLLVGRREAVVRKIEFTSLPCTFPETICYALN